MSQQHRHHGDQKQLTAEGEVHTTRYSTLVFLLGIGTAAAGAAALFGWWFDISVLKSVRPEWVTMKPNTAAGFVFAGASLALSARAGRSVMGRRLSLALALATALVGMLTLCEYLPGVGLGIDQLLYHFPPAPDDAFAPGRMAPSRAIASSPPNS